jgi:hypothetical protein
MGLPTYASLVNEKAIIPPGSSPYFGVREHFFQSCMAERLAKVRVDEAWYLEAYPDVRDAIAAGIVPDVRTHFLMFGYYEHRMPHAIDVDEAWYLVAYPDVHKAIQRRHFASAQDHFNQYGYREGRLPCANFVLAEQGEGAAQQ